MRDVILGRIAIPDEHERMAHNQRWIDREEALETAYDEIDFQGDYTRELVDQTDYPEFDTDLVNQMFTADRHDGAAHHTPWVHAIDDSLESFLADG